MKKVKKNAQWARPPESEMSPLEVEIYAIIKRMHKKRPKTEKAELELFCDIAWSMAVKERAKYLCAKCGKLAVNSHHIFKRQHKNTKWDIRNGVPFCGAHHEFWAHNDDFDIKQEYVKFIASIRDFKTMSELYIEAHKTAHFSIADMIHIKNLLLSYIEKEREG